jgi:penicillin amidase
VISLPLTPEQRQIARDALAHSIAPSEDLLELVRAYLSEKADLGPSSVTTSIGGQATIDRDARGVPHIEAESAADLYFALGYAEAQDRLWQLDYLRRLGHGRLAEIFGAERLNDDILARTLNITGIAGQSLAALLHESREALESFSAGINAWMADLPNGLPAEFEWLGYEPEPWSPIDSLAVIRRWWWYLTGRLHVLWTPDVVRTALDPDRFMAYYTPDAEVGYIVPEGAYDPTPLWPPDPQQPGFTPMGGGEGGEGSNNWAVGSTLSATGSALLASDPHVYYTVPAEWYEAELSINGNAVFGCSYPGMPAFLIGRNEHLAWGITNNICLQRDLYIEQLNAAGDRYWGDGDWREFETRTESITVKDAPAYGLEIRSANGRPIIDHLVPVPAHPKTIWPETWAKSAVSLAWVGFEPSDELQCGIELATAKTIAEGREAFRGWKLPTWNIVLADTAGEVAYQCIGHLPLRESEWIGYRQANDPRDRWQHPIPFDAMPAFISPERGWVGSANNPTAPADYPYPLFGCWTPEDRFPRLSQLIEERAPHTIDSFVGMQADIFTGRGSRAVPGIVAAIGTPQAPIEAAALAQLADWDGELGTDSVAGSVYNVFFWRWHQRVIREHFSPEWIAIANESGNGLSAALLHENHGEWFADEAARRTAIGEAFSAAVAWLSDKLGGDPDTWHWGRLHTLGGIHPAARTPLQHQLFDVEHLPHQGGTSTLANAHFGLGGSFTTRLGASYRFITDLADAQSTLAICWPGQSGQPGSPHFSDQHQPYLEDAYFPAHAKSITTFELHRRTS